MQFFPNTGAIQTATLLRGYLADSTLRLFKSDFIPSVSSTLAQFVEAECDYTGYLNVVMDTWFSPVLNPAGGASIDSPTVQFQTATPYTLGNVVGGWFVVDGGGTVVVAAGTFANGIPMGAPNQGFPMNVTLVFPNGQ